jgi:O-antigen/teichoic acid export membrane protein
MDVARRLRHSQFLRHNAIFFFGSVLVGALNYLYYPVLGRLMAPASFGEVQTIVSLFLQLSIFLTVLSLVVVNIVTNTTGEGQRNELVFEFEKLAVAVAVVLVISSLVFGKQLQSFLQFTSPWPFVLLALAVLVNVPFTLRAAVLRGKQRFGLVSAANIIAAGGKIALSAGLVLIGLSTSGAIGGLVLAQLAAGVFVVVWAFKLGLRHARGRRRFGLPDMRRLAPELKYGLFVLVGSLAITLQYSIDVIVAKHYFDAHTAGLYAGIASVARVIFFLTVSVSQVLLSAVRLRHRPQQNSQLLFRSLILVSIVGLPALLLLAITPGTAVKLLMGGSYEALSPLLPRLSLAVFIVSILNLLAIYYLALRRYSVAIVAALGMALTYVLLLWRHQTPADIVDSMLLGSIATLCLFGLWAAINKALGGSQWQTNEG